MSLNIKFYYQNTFSSSDSERTKPFSSFQYTSAVIRQSICNFRQIVIRLALHKSLRILTYFRLWRTVEGLSAPDPKPSVTQAISGGRELRKYHKSVSRRICVISVRCSALSPLVSCPETETVISVFIQFLVWKNPGNFLRAALSLIACLLSLGMRFGNGYLTQEESDKQDYILHMNQTHIFIVAFTYNF